MIKLVASDLDGTLLNEEGEISDFTRKAILQIQERGVRFVVCTGRDYDAAFKPLNDAGIVCDFICASGACLYPVGADVQYNGSLMPYNCIAEIDDIFSRNGLIADMITTAGRKSTSSREAAFSFYTTIWPEAVVKGGLMSDEETARNYAVSILDTIEFSLDLKKFYETEKQAVFKVNTTSKEQNILADAEKELLATGHFVVESSFPYNLELTLAGVQKGPAVQRYARSKGIADKDVMIFGDSRNDLSMFQTNFGYTCAMENGTDDIKKLAKYIAEPNIHDGVARLLQRFILSEDPAAVCC